MNQLTQMKFLSDHELEKLLKLCNKHKKDRNSILLRFILFTGCRSIEALNVIKSDVENGSVTIKGVKNSNNRTVPLPPDFYKELSKYTKDLDTDQRLFPIGTRYLRYIWDQYRPNRKKGLHSLRHTFGIKFYEHCLDLHALKTALGHKAWQSTHIYLDYVESQKILREKMKGMWNGAA